MTKSASERQIQFPVVTSPEGTKKKIPPLNVPVSPAIIKVSKLKQINKKTVSPVRQYIIGDPDEEQRKKDAIGKL